MNTAMSLPELARAAGVRLSDARRYLKLGLIQPPTRFRARGELALQAKHIDRLRFIREALDAGFSIENIATLFEAHATCEDIYALATRRVAELRDELGPQTLSAAVLEQLANKCDRTGPKTDCALLAVLNISHKARGAPKDA